MRNYNSITFSSAQLFNDLLPLVCLSQKTHLTVLKDWLTPHSKSGLSTRTSCSFTIEIIYSRHSKGSKLELLTMKFINSSNFLNKEFLYNHKVQFRAFSNTESEYRLYALTTQSDLRQKETGEIKPVIMKILLNSFI